MSIGLYLDYSNETLPNHIETFINFTLSDDGQNIVEESGYIRAYDFSPYTYTFPICYDDNYEENDEFTSAYNFSQYEETWLHNIDGYGVQVDYDWYKILVSSGEEQLIVKLIFNNSEGNLDIGIYDNSLELIDYGISSTDNETINHLLPSDGIYYIYITGKNNKTRYDLWWQCIDVKVQIPPKAFNMFTDADDPDTDGTFNLTWSKSIGADNYSVYRSNNQISNLNDCTEIKSNITDLNYTVVGMNTGTHYFIIVAYNATGFTLSDYVQVNVSIPVSPLPPVQGGSDDDDGGSSDTKEISGYNVSLISITIILVLFSIIYLAVKKRSYKKH